MTNQNAALNRIWKKAMEEAAEVCKDQSIRFCEAMNGKAAYGATECEKAILARSPVPQVEEMPWYVIVHRPGLVPDRKGGFYDRKLVENTLRELYDLYPDCVCDVIQMPDTCYPDSGREWLAMYGDKRRKPLPEAVAPQSEEAAPAEAAKIEQAQAGQDERESFEREIRKLYEIGFAADDADLLKRDHCDEYLDNRIENAWIGWQVRASLAQPTPVVSDDTVAAEQHLVAWVRRHPDGALTAEFLEAAVIEPVRKKSGAWVPLYTHPAAVQMDEQGDRDADFRALQRIHAKLVERRNNLPQDMHYAFNKAVNTVEREMLAVASAIQSALKGQK